MSDKVKFVVTGITLGCTMGAVIGGILLWCFSVERRLGVYETAMDLNARVVSIDERISRLETLLVPIIVEYRVRVRTGESPFASGLPTDVRPPSGHDPTLERPDAFIREDVDYEPVPGPPLDPFGPMPEEAPAEAPAPSPPAPMMPEPVPAPPTPLLPGPVPNPAVQQIIDEEVGRVKQELPKAW